MDDTREIKRRPGQYVPVDRTRLRRARLEAGLTVAELADKAGIGRQHVSDVESGRRRASIKAVRQLAAALDRPVADLLTPERDDHR